MKILRRLSVGGWIFLIHFTSVALVFSLPILLPQPQASIASGDDWYWRFLDYSEEIFFWLTLPASYFMSHPKDGPLYLLDYPITGTTLVPFLVILALNSLLVGYTFQLIASVVRLRRRRSIA